MPNALLRVQGLAKTFGKGRRAHRALDDVTFDINEGEVLGLVGESGSGKSTTLRCMMGLERPTAGSIIYNGEFELGSASKAQLAAYRRDVQMVFQDPFSSLNPRMTVRQILEEPMVVVGGFPAAERRERILSLLNMVGMSEQHLERYPRDFSGGQRQRIAIVRALTVGPKLLVCDEPVSALDVSVQAQVLNLLKDMQRQLNLTVLFIAHDLAVVKYLCDRLVVLNQGRVAEAGPVARVYADPTSEYTRELLAAVPVPDPRLERQRRRGGPSPVLATQAAGELA
ncbi:dipeptide ABC transporter ATP-binding protein [Arthrobacter ginkgonis]|uniref:Dipeptide ABC transporter ATP-binding protein n=1 Tax=Arthrobacter ginkgonis TaxID=1630594 RepID=A0ABP7CXD0_9MICC